MLESLEQPDIIKKLKIDWATVLSSQNSQHDKNSSINVETAWSDVYHALIHSPALEALLRLEHSYSVAMKDLVREKTDAMEALRNKYTLLYYYFSNIIIIIPVLLVILIKMVQLFV